MKIKELARIINDKIDGKTLSAYNYISTENMLPNFMGVTSSTSVSNQNVTAFLPQDILISNIRPYFRKIWFASYGGGCSNDVICVRSKDSNCLPKFLFYLLNTDHFIDTFVASSKGTKMPRGDKQALLNYDFYLPSVIQQQHIVDNRRII